MHPELNRVKPVDSASNPSHVLPLSSPRASRYVDIRYINASTFPSSRPKAFPKTTKVTVEPQSRKCSNNNQTNNLHPDPRNGTNYQKQKMNVSAPPNLFSSRSPRKNHKPCGTRRNSNPSNMKSSQVRTSRKSAVPRSRLHHTPQPEQPSTRIRSPQIGPYSDPREDIRFASSPQCKSDSLWFGVVSCGYLINHCLRFRFFDSDTHQPTLIAHTYGKLHRA